MRRAFKLVFKEVFYTLFLIIGVTGLLFLLLNLMPGVFPGKGLELHSYFHLLRRLFTFRFGTSVVSGVDINSIVFPAFKNTLVLTIGSMFISVMIAVPIGIFSAFRGFKSYSWPLVIFAYVVSSIPVFYFGYLVLYLISHYTGSLPIYTPQGPFRGIRVLSYILPVIVLGLGNDSTSEIVRLITNELDRVMATDYVLASKARGESVLKSSISEGIVIPLVSIVFSKIPFLIGGAVVVEHVFNWPGMGRLAFQSTLERDLPVLIVIAFLSVLMVRAGMILKDVILYQFSPGGKSQ